MEQLSAMEAYSSSELLFPATPGIIIANEINYPPNDNNLVPDGSPDASKQHTNCGPEGKNGEYIFFYFLGSFSFVHALVFY